MTLQNFMIILTYLCHLLLDALLLVILTDAKLLLHTDCTSTECIFAGHSRSVGSKYPRYRNRAKASSCRCVPISTVDYKIVIEVLLSY